MSIIGIVLGGTDLVVIADHAATANDPASPYGVRVLEDRDKLFVSEGVALAVGGICGVTDGIRALDLVQEARQVLDLHAAHGPVQVAKELLQLFNSEAEFVRTHGEAIDVKDEFGGGTPVLALALVAGIVNARPLAFTIALTAEGSCRASKLVTPGIGLAPAGTEHLMQTAIGEAAHLNSMSDRIARLDQAVKAVFIKRGLMVTRRWSYAHLAAGSREAEILTVTPRPLKIPRGA